MSGKKKEVRRLAYHGQNFIGCEFRLDHNLELHELSQWADDSHTGSALVKHILFGGSCLACGELIFLERSSNDSVICCLELDVVPGLYTMLIPDPLVQIEIRKACRENLGSTTCCKSRNTSQCINVALVAC